MIKCPNCGSAENFILLDTLWSEDGWTAYRINTYQCSCTRCFKTLSVFECKYACEDIIDEGE